MMEETRFDAAKLVPDVLKGLAQVEGLIARQLDPRLFHLIKMRASQINGCAYCLDMHSHDALAAGEEPQRLFVLDGWEESPVFTDKERAALAWTDAITRISETHAPQDVYDQLKACFSEAEIANLTLAAALINAWNWIAIPARTRHKVRVKAVAGSQPGAAAA